MRSRPGWSFAWLAVTFVSAASCSSPPKGGLMLAVSTDFQVPKDIDILSVYVATGGKTKFDYLARLAPQGTLELPATLAIVEPGDPGAQVRIRVIGFEEQDARVLRDVITTVPAGGSPGSGNGGTGVAGTLGAGGTGSNGNTCNCAGGGGGGGGYYGGGGGSSYAIATATAVSNIQSTTSGNGSVTLSY